MTRTAYIEMVTEYGRKWMLSTLHHIGLKQGYKQFSNTDLAEILYNHSTYIRKET